MGSQGAMAWNLVLDEKGGPHAGGCAGCAGLITADFSGAQPVLRYEPQFYALAQVSAFVRRGAERVEVVAPSDPELNASAFLNPDGTVNFIAWNGSDSPKHIEVERDRCESFSYTLSSKTAVTFQWSDKAPALPMM
jgi:glucosylceramidase